MIYVFAVSVCAHLTLLLAQKVAAMNIVKGQGMPDFVMLDSIDENTFIKVPSSSVLFSLASRPLGIFLHHLTTQNLHDRFKQKQIYTYIGEQVVAMNPFQKMDIYSKEIMNEYKNRELYEVQPHIYALADDTFRNLMRCVFSPVCLCAQHPCLP